MDETKKARPECATDEVLTFLDELRESGEINMFGAAPYVEEEFGLKRQEAREAVIYWMHTFSERHLSR